MKNGITDLTSTFNDKLQLYKTESGAYIIDSSDLEINDNPESPILLTKQSISRGLTTTSLYDFKYIPTSVCTIMKHLRFIIKIATASGIKIISTKSGIFDSTDILTLSELNSEAIYNLDFNKDNSIGDTIVSVLAIRCN